MNSELDALLAQPLPDMPDSGFSARILARIGKAEMRRARFELAAWIVLVLGMTAAFAFSRPGREMAAMALSLNAAAQIGVIMTVVLMVFALRETTE
jgi:hypothetical protein